MKAPETPNAETGTPEAGSSDVQRLVMRHVHELLDALDAEGIQPDEVHEYARHQAIEYRVRELYRALGREPVVPDA